MVAERVADRVQLREGRDDQGHRAAPAGRRRRRGPGRGDHAPLGQAGRRLLQPIDPRGGRPGRRTARGSRSCTASWTPRSARARHGSRRSTPTAPTPPWSATTRPASRARRRFTSEPVWSPDGDWILWKLTNGTTAKWEGAHPDGSARGRRPDRWRAGRLAALLHRMPTRCIRAGSPRRRRPVSIAGCARSPRATAATPSPPSRSRARAPRSRSARRRRVGVGVGPGSAVLGQDVVGQGRHGGVRRRRDHRATRGTGRRRHASTRPTRPSSWTCSRRPTRRSRTGGRPARSRTTTRRRPVSIEDATVDEGGDRARSPRRCRPRAGVWSR